MVWVHYVERVLFLFSFISVQVNGKKLIGRMPGTVMTGLRVTVLDITDPQKIVSVCHYQKCEVACDSDTTCSAT